MTFSQPLAAVAATSVVDFELDLAKSQIFFDTRWKEDIWHDSLVAFAIMYFVPVSQSEGFFIGSQSHVPAAYMHERHQARVVHWLWPMSDATTAIMAKQQVRWDQPACQAA